MKLRCYHCTVKGQPWSGETPIHAMTAGKARYQFWTNIRESWPDIPLIACIVKSAGAPRNTPRFESVKAYRGVSFNIGSSVIAGGKRGVIVGADYGANFCVLFEDGQRGPCHPSDIQIAEAAQ